MLVLPVTNRKDTELEQPLAADTYSGLLQFETAEAYATVELTGSAGKWVSTWYCSVSSEDDYGNVELSVVGHLQLPVFGESRADAVRRCGFIAEEIISAMTYGAEGAGTGTGLVGGGGAGKGKHCRAHLQYWSEELGVVAENAKTERIVLLYCLAVDFGVNAPASLVADVEVLPSVRMVHDRIAYARRIGLLDSYGKGRVRFPADLVGVEPESERGTREENEEREQEIIERVLRNSGL